MSPVFDDPAALHDDDAAGEEAGDGDVVGHQHDGNAEAGDQGADEVEQAGLDGDVEAAGGLVHEDEAGVG